uniref:Uncharacterized protein n=1 Tax=Tanacetum cinerariifolium TaxID=118510 RepID=A0A6L2M9Q2_TANCI|nr:hypothetical protein [Tanacetum cinerariifolium]
MTKCLDQGSQLCPPILSSVDNDVEFGINKGTTNLVNNGANSSGFSFMNVKNSSTSNTLIIDKIKKFEDSLIDGQVILVDEAGNPLKNVECSGDYDSKDEVASVDNDMTRYLASEMVGFGTQSLLEQWKDSYGNGEFDEDPYDDDMLEASRVGSESVKHELELELGLVPTIRTCEKYYPSDLLTKCYYGCDKDISLSIQGSTPVELITGSAPGVDNVNFG